MPSALSGWWLLLLHAQGWASSAEEEPISLSWSCGFRAPCADSPFQVSSCTLQSMLDATNKYILQWWINIIGLRLSG